MEPFEGPPGNSIYDSLTPRGKKFCDSLAPDERDKFLQDVAHARREGAQEGKEFVDRYIENVLEGEIEEWTTAIEQASSPEERKLIITAILCIGFQEKLLGQGDQKSDEEMKKSINMIRIDHGLSPKYPEQV